MKQLSEIAWNVSEPEYRADPALSYSTLSSYERNGRFNALEILGEQISTPSLTFGSMVDTLLTDSEEEFQNKFIVVDDPGISDNLKEITSKLFGMYGQTRMRFEDIPDDVTEEESSVVEEPAMEEPVIIEEKNIVAEEPSDEEPPVEELVSEEPVVEEPSVEDPVAGEPEELINFYEEELPEERKSVPLRWPDPGYP